MPEQCITGCNFSIYISLSNFLSILTSIPELSMSLKAGSVFRRIRSQEVGCANHPLAKTRQNAACFANHYYKLDARLQRTTRPSLHQNHRATGRTVFLIPQIKSFKFLASFLLGHSITHSWASFADRRKYKQIKKLDIC